MFPQIFGKYVLERELAKGGMAHVYLATLRGAVGFEKRLVVKQIRPELSLDEAFVRRFVEEAKIAVELSHPNIVPVYELGVEQGIYYIAMELCEGLTLTEILTATGPLDAAEGAYLGVEICRALDYAHRRGGIVHRDVTPRNVLLDEEGAVRIIDFGIAAPVSGARAGAPLEVFGSPGHMPPEQIRGQRLTAATDVFAVGALLIEAWTGHAPFRRSTFEASVDALKEPLARLDAGRPELSPVADVIAQAVALSMADRPQEAESLARKLRDFSRQFDSGDVAKRLGERVRRTRRRAPSHSRPWLAGDSSGPLTPAATPLALQSGRPSAGPATPPLAPFTPPGAVPITRTFAARDDLIQWTRKIPSVPPAERATDSRRAAASSPPSASPAEASQEPATRRYSGSKPPPSSSGRWLAAALVLAVAALLTTVLVVSSPGARAPLSSASASGRPSSAPVDARVLQVAPRSMPPEIAAFAASAAPSAPSPSRPAAARPSTLATAPGPASAAATPGSLKLTADPSATVTVVGGRVAQTEVTPVRELKLPPGNYAVTFRSATFASPVVARVELAAGASRSVHADFRAAMPTVVVR